MATERVTDALSGFLSVLLWIIGSAIVGIGIALMLTMDASSAAQGWRFFIAVIAILLIAVVERQLRWLMRRRLPLSLTPLPEERRYARNALLLMSAVSILLLGLALYLTAGPSWGLLRVFAYILALAALPFFLAFVLPLLKRPFERGLDVLFGGGAVPTHAPRTFTFSFGTPPRSTLDDAPVTRPVTMLSSERVEHYRNAWAQVRASFGSDAAQAVREGHALILELCAETGQLPPLVRGEQFVLSDLSAAMTEIERILAHMLARAATPG
jgi:hypothetical protein